LSRPDNQQHQGELEIAHGRPGPISADLLIRHRYRRTEQFVDPVLILGEDQWVAVIFVAWAELPDNVILPLAIESLNSRALSTDATEGNALLPLRLVGQGVGVHPAVTDDDDQ
jgi:hypothetical protein